jgi:DMSO/TMAO reductase YedYZ molybdopterin-dependent catalytic subunit
MEEKAPRGTEEGTPARRYGRAVFLGTIGTGLSSLLWGKAAWSHISGAISPGVESVFPLLPSNGWRIYSVADHMPDIDRSTWRLSIRGLVSQAHAISFEELGALPRAEQVSTFHCVTGWTVENVHWAGVRIGDVLASAQPTAAAHALRFVSAEYPYVDYLTMEQVALPDVMLAYEMDGKPLTRAHGAPLRLVIPEMYGYKGVKWLQEIELVSRPAWGYWEYLGYDRDAWVGRSNGHHA